MKVYLEDKAIYARNDDNLVYKVESMEVYDGYNSLRLNLALICGLGADGLWCSASKFPEDVQSEQEICYIMQESVKECLEANDYQVMNSLPERLQTFIEQENDEVER